MAAMRRWINAAPPSRASPLLQSRPWRRHGASSPAFVGAALAAKDCIARSAADRGQARSYSRGLGVVTVSPAQLVWERPWPRWIASPAAPPSRASPLLQSRPWCRHGVSSPAFVGAALAAMRRWINAAAPSRASPLLQSRPWCRHGVSSPAFVGAALAAMRRWINAAAPSRASAVGWVKRGATQHRHQRARHARRPSGVRVSSQFTIILIAKGRYSTRT